MNGTGATLELPRTGREILPVNGAELKLDSTETLPPLEKSPFPSFAQIPNDFRIHVKTQQYYLCGGKMLPWYGQLQDVHSPIPMRWEGGQEFHPLLGSYPWMDKFGALTVLDAAKASHDGGRGVWPNMPTDKRIECVNKFLDRMLEVRSEVVNLIMWEIGKTLPDAQKEFDRTVDYVRDSIKALQQMEAESKVIAKNNGFASRVEHTPRGVVLCMGPFNYPLNETFTTLMPALLMGNSVVLKAPKIGVLLYEPLLRAFKQSFPPGVVNTVYGDGAETITPIMKDGGVDCLAFIGSGKVADLVTNAHPEKFRLHPVLGLGAKNPGIVLDDANMDRAVSECVAGALTFNGQRCTALKILFVQRGIAGEFVERFSAKVAALRQGMPWQKGVQITPLAEPNKVQYMRDYIDDAVAYGARVTNPGGGEAAQTLFTPAVLYPVSPESRIYKEEQFGPVVPIVPFDDPREVLDWMKASPYGQQLSVFGTDPQKIAEIALPARNLVTRINLNTQCQRGPDVLPFGGRKGSAMGTLSIREALEQFSIETVYAGKDEDLTQSFLQEAA